jgi:rare lipoprotein A
MRTIRPSLGATRPSAILVAATLFAGCGAGAAAGAAAEAEAGGRWQPVGIASWYGAAHEGRPTATGRPYRMRDLTAAHPTLPHGTRLLVTNLRNGRKVVVRVSDRGPHGGKRIIDLSRAAAERLDMLEGGLALVRIEKARPGERG